MPRENQRKEMITLKHKEKETLENVIRIRSRGDLLICLMGYLKGYLSGAAAEHKVIKWAYRTARTAILLTALAVVFVVVSYVPNIWKFPKDSETIVSVAKAAEEEVEADTPEETGENADKEHEEQEPEDMAEETESKPDPLDDSLMAPSDVYAEKGHPAVFKAYHPQAEEYQWEIYDIDTESWKKAPEEAVVVRQDELLREISSLQLTSDRDQSIRCKIGIIRGTPITYEADLHILSSKIQSIAADEFSVQAGEYVCAMDIPVKVTYQDGSQDEITGLSGLSFMEQTESTRASATECGNLKETITTIRTACDYDHVEDMGSQDVLLCYRPSEEASMDIPIAIKGVDMMPPQITSLTVDGYEISTVDQIIPVTVTIKAIDEVTPTRQLEYAFLPEGVEVSEAEWMKEASFTVEIDQNGLWTAYVKDESGNIASEGKNLVVVDNKAPEIELHLETQNSWCKENQIYVSAEDALPVQYRYLCEETGEDSGWIDESSKGIRENGTWKIQVQDSIGNVVEQSITIENIDTQSPIIRSIKEKTEKESISNEE